MAIPANAPPIGLFLPSLEAAPHCAPPRLTWGWKLELQAPEVIVVG